MNTSPSNQSEITNILDKTPAKSLPYVEAIKQGYRVLTKEQRILYQPNLLSRRKFILEATPPKGHWAYHDTTK